MNQFFPTSPANTGKDSCGVNTSLPLTAVLHAQYFALNTKLQFGAKTSFSLLLILLALRSGVNYRIQQAQAFVKGLMTPGAGVEIINDDTGYRFLLSQG